MQTTNRYGNAVAYTYATGSTTIKDPAGRTTIKWFDASGFVTKSQDPEGRIATAEYYLDTAGVNKYGEEKIIVDRYGNKTEYVRDTTNGNILTQINPDSSKYEYAYDTKNNLISEKDETGRATYYVYDAAMTKLLQKAQPLNGTDVYDAKADPDRFAITTYDYYTDAESSQLGYKAKGLLRSETDPEGNVTAYEYDAQGNKTAVTDPDGNTTSFEYNGLGWLTAKVSPTGYRTEFAYDKAGRLFRTVLDGGETSFTEYDALGRPVQKVTPNVYKSSEDGLNDTPAAYTYKNDNVGERYTYWPNGMLQTTTDALGFVTSYTYDVYGNLSSESKPNGAVYLYQYDVMNRLKKTLFKRSASDAPVTLETVAYGVLANGSTTRTVTTYFSDSDTASTVYTIDKNGREVGKRLPDGSSTSTAYDVNGLVQSVKDARGNSTYYRYDGLGRLMATWSPLDNGKYSYKGTVYDKAGRAIASRTGKDAVSLYTIPADDRVMWAKSTYTASGQVAGTTDSAGGKTQLTYDEEGALIRQEVSTAKDEVALTEFEYNHLGKPVVQKQHVRNGDLDGNASDDDGDTAILTTYEYDAEGQLKKQTAPDGVVTSFSYDALGHLLSTRTEGLDENGNPAELVTATTYDWAGQPLTQVDAKGNVTSFEYDRRGFLIAQTDALGGIAQYQYDRGGRKTKAASRSKSRTTSPPGRNIRTTS
ncbi:RHS repeat domain-containing protein [Cohnella faecalis]|uniref:RHS repeat protein n=1 Tax=Cohnella faecalis TaxID=2315694 RepID=A0A398CH56_9BACL|nr:RHS repeat protein [Cohnella faecalis]RIE02546.1 RHS repeat protein [Cohnella faecalis]